MDSFNCHIHLEPTEAEELFYVLDRINCINPKNSICDMCYHYPACKFIVDFRNNLKRYLENIEEQKSEEE